MTIEHGPQGIDVAFTEGAMLVGINKTDLQRTTDVYGHTLSWIGDGSIKVPVVEHTGDRVLVSAINTDPVLSELTGSLSEEQLHEAWTNFRYIAENTDFFNKQFPRLDVTFNHGDMISPIDRTRLGEMDILYINNGPKKGNNSVLVAAYLSGDRDAVTDRLGELGYTKDIREN